MEIIEWIAIAVVLVVIGGFEIYRRRRYQRMLTEPSTASTTTCPKCGVDVQTVAPCPKCGFDTADARKRGLDEHVDFLSDLDQIRTTLEGARDRASGPLGTVGNVLGLLPFDSSIDSLGKTHKRERLADAQDEMMRGLRRLGELLDDHDTLCRLETPDGRHTVESLLSEAFSVDDLSSLSNIPMWEQARMHREIGQVIDAIDRARQTIARHVDAASNESADRDAA